MRNDEIQRRLRERHARRCKPTNSREVDEEATSRENQYLQHLIENQQINDSNVSNGPKLLGYKSALRDEDERKDVEEMLSATASTTGSGSVDDESPTTGYNRGTDVPIIEKSSIDSLDSITSTGEGTEKVGNYSCMRRHLDPLEIAPAISQESFPNEAIRRNQEFLYEYDRPQPQQYSINSNKRINSSIDLNNNEQLALTSTSHKIIGIPLRSIPDESLEVSAIEHVGVSSEFSQLAEHTFTLNEEMPEDERNASEAGAQYDDNHSGEDIFDFTEEYLMVSRSYVEVCLPSSYDREAEKRRWQKQEEQKDANNSSVDLFEELRSGGLPLIVRKFQEELDDIKANFRCLGEDIAEAAVEIHNNGQSFLADVFVSR